MGLVDEYRVMVNYLEIQKQLNNLLLLKYGILFRINLYTDRPPSYINWTEPSIVYSIPLMGGGLSLNVNVSFKMLGEKKKIANICWIIEKTREFQKNICFCFTDYTKAFDCVDYNNCGKFLKR